MEGWMDGWMHADNGDEEEVEEVEDGGLFYN